MRKKLIWIAPLAILAIAAFIALGGEVVMHLWNWLLPALVGLPKVTFWQALALLALCRILFGNWGGHHSRRPGFNRKMSDRWQKMTPEDREKFRQSFRGSCGPSDAPGGGGAV